MAKRKRAPAQLDARRKAALDGVPYQLPVADEKIEDGKLLVTVEFMRPRWQVFLGAAVTNKRTFRLDAYGRQVYEACDGRQSVRQIVHRFAKRTKVSKPEAEMAVTKFMRTLLAKGLVAMQMEKPST